MFSHISTLIAVSQVVGIASAAVAEAQSSHYYIGNMAHAVVRLYEVRAQNHDITIKENKPLVSGLGCKLVANGCPSDVVSVFYVAAEVHASYTSVGEQYATICRTVVDDHYLALHILDGGLQHTQLHGQFRHKTRAVMVVGGYQYRQSVGFTFIHSFSLRYLAV